MPEHLAQLRVGFYLSRASLLKITHADRTILSADDWFYLSVMPVKRLSKRLSKQSLSDKGQH